MSAKSKQSKKNACITTLSNVMARACLFGRNISLLITEPMFNVCPRQTLI